MSVIIIATAQAKAHKRCGEQCTNLTVNKRYFPPTQRHAIPFYQSQSLLGCQQDVLYVPIHVCLTKFWDWFRGPGSVACQQRNLGNVPNSILHVTIGRNTDFRSTPKATPHSIEER